MLDPFQKQVLRVLAANRSPDSFVAGGSALNRATPRLSRDIDLFHKTVALIDGSVAHDLRSLEAVGWKASRDRETSTMREWTVRDAAGHATKIQWTRDTSWLFMPPVPDPEFGYVLTFEDLAVNKMSAAADRGRRRDFHDLAALDLQGVRPWVLALAAMGKDAELSPVATLERALRLLRQAGEDDEDPDYEGGTVPWASIRSRMGVRLREDLGVLEGFRWMDWAGALALERSTGRMALDIEPGALRDCDKGRATPHGSWPTTLAATSEMLRAATHPHLRAVTLDLGELARARTALVAEPQAGGSEDPDRLLLP